MVLVLNDSVDAVVWRPEELEGIVAAIDASFRQHLQNVEQDSARFLNGLHSRGDVIGQKAGIKLVSPHLVTLFRPGQGGKLIASIVRAELT